MRASLIVTLTAVLTATSGCFSVTTDGGSGGASGSEGTYDPPTCGQSCQDFLVAYGVNDTLWFLWNGYIAGRPSGATNTMGTCPLGGTARISGTTGVSSNGINTADLVFVLSGCTNSSSLYEFSYTGEVSMVGSFNSDTEFAAMSFSSTSLQATGTATYLDEPTVTETCATNFAQEGTGDAWSLDGKMCGRSFDSDTALDPYSDGNGGSGGSSGNSTGGTSSTGARGGSSSSGGTSSDCRCYCPDNSDCTNSTAPNPCGVDVDGIPNVCGCPVGCR